ncbi:MAG: ABC transporter ATP-binding protein [Candidatus Omnitrophica bacterium]|nr:ABC transporter ATP-binding protein [Candidatus Omnitrophota bacterium]
MSKRAELISVHNVTREYAMPAADLTVLKGVNFSLAVGDFAFIVGRSGSGKSTLLHLLGGLDQPTSGKILFEGEDMTEMSEKDLARVRNRRMGLVFQFYHLLPELTLFENVLLPSLIAGKANPKWAKECLRKVKLSSRSGHFPSELSGGEKQRAAMARALVNRPSLVLCDEPTGNLDSETAESVVSLMEDLNEKDGVAFVVVTHDETLAARHPDVYRLKDGSLEKQALMPRGKAAERS